MYKKNMVITLSGLHINDLEHIKEKVDNGPNNFFILNFQ